MYITYNYYCILHKYISTKDATYYKSYHQLNNVIYIECMHYLGILVYLEYYQFKNI